jgi:hypothetical protein
MNVLITLHSLGVTSGIFTKLDDGKSQLKPLQSPIVQTYKLSKVETDFCLANIPGFTFGIKLNF